LASEAKPRNGVADLVQLGLTIILAHGPDQLTQLLQ
jgi:hypothetical protein